MQLSVESILTRFSDLDSDIRACGFDWEQLVSVSMWMHQTLAAVESNDLRRASAALRRAERSFQELDQPAH